MYTTLDVHSHAQTTRNPKHDLFCLYFQQLGNLPGAVKQSLSDMIIYNKLGNYGTVVTKWEHLLSFGGYLIPKNNLWLKRACLLFGFILLDYLTTLIFIKTPADEGNLLVRAFMENYGTILGLTIFDVLINLPIYLIISFNSHFVALPSRLSKVIDPIIDLFLAWFVAGYHYSGATSWFWAGSDLMRQTVGFSIYVLILAVASQASTIHHVFISKQKPCIQ